jgi:hypothetical protein
VADKCPVVELSHPVMSAHKRSEKREYVITWVKVGVKFEHEYPENCVVKSIYAYVHMSNIIQYGDASVEKMKDGWTY